MIYGLEVPIFIGRVFLVCAAVTTTAFPILYAFLPWYHSFLGRVVMTQAVTIALAIDLKFVLTVFTDPENRAALLWVNVGIVLAIALTSGLLCYILISIRLENRRKRKRHAPQQAV